jgi:hypothetical protein
VPSVLDLAGAIEGKLHELWVESDEKRSARMNARTRKPTKDSDWLFIAY